MILLDVSFLNEKSTGIHTVIRNIERVFNDNKVKYKTISYYDYFKTKNKILWIIYYNIIINLKLIRLKNNDIFFLPANLGGMYFIIKNKAKAFFLIYDIFEISECKSKLKKNINKLRFSFLIKKMDKIITISKDSCLNIKKYFPNAEKKVFVVYLFVEYQFENLIDIKKYAIKLANIGHYILANGSGQERKNIIFLIENMKSLYQKYGFKLILIGKDFYKNQYKTVLSSISESDCADIIYHFGEVSNEELFFLYKNAECFVFPSLNEGFGLPPLEALAGGCKILISNIPIFREIFYPMNCFFDFNSCSLEKAFENMLREDNDQFIFKRKLILELYSYEKYSSELLKIFAI